MSNQLVNLTSVQTVNTTSQRMTWTRAGLVAVAAAVAAATVNVAQAQEVVPNGSARIVEWNCPFTGQEVPPDPFPGALMADGSKVWYVTRAVPRLVRVTPGTPFETGLATCNWWHLEELTITTAGLRLRPANTLAYIREPEALHRVNTVTNAHTRWDDQLLSFSDVAIGTSGSTTYVYTTGNAALQVPDPSLPNDVVQRFNPATSQATRWQVGGGAGSNPIAFLSGIDVHPNNANLVYYSEPDSNMIGELNTSTNVVRRWNLALAVASVDPDVVFLPRQLDVAMGGMVWVVTGSGHLVRLNPTTNQVLVAAIPSGGLPTPGNPMNNPFGIDAEGVVGFTTAGETMGFNKVGMFFPDGSTFTIPPTTSTAVRETVPVPSITQPAPQFTARMPPVVKTALATETETLSGTFFEALIDTGTPADPSICGTPEDPDPTDAFVPEDPCTLSTQPIGVDDDPTRPAGAYYAAIGASMNRIAHVTLPVDAAGMVSGGGWIETTTTTTTVNPLTGLTSATSTSDKGTFGLVAMRRRAGDPVRGHVTYQNHATGGKVISLELTDLEFIDGHKAIIRGLCKADTSDCVQFSADITDNGQPRSTMSDEFKIGRDPVGLGTTGGAGTVAEGGPLQGGNLKVYRQY
jgi:hypothetical protein